VNGPFPRLHAADRAELFVRKQSRKIPAAIKNPIKRHDVWRYAKGDRDPTLEADDAQSGKKIVATNAAFGKFFKSPAMASIRAI